MYRNDENILKITNMIALPNSNAINIEKFITIIQGNMQLGLSLLMLFKQQAYEYLDNLNYAIAISDTNPHKLFEAIHAIKGASLSIAADKIRLLSEQIEKQIHDKKKINHNDFHSLVQATQELLNHITTIEMRQLLEKSL